MIFISSGSGFFFRYRKGLLKNYTIEAHACKWHDGQNYFPQRVHQA
jgi:hypothetical protein